MSEQIDPRGTQHVPTGTAQEPQGRPTPPTGVQPAPYEPPRVPAAFPMGPQGVPSGTPASVAPAVAEPSDPDPTGAAGASAPTATTVPGDSVIVPPADAAPPVPPMSGGARVLHAFRWLAASVGAFGAVFGIQIAISLIAGIGLGVIALMANLNDAAYNRLLSDITLPLTAFAQIACLAATIPWWRHLAPRSFLAHRRRVVPRISVPLAVAGIIILGIGAQLLIDYILNLVLPLFPDVLSDYNDLMEAGGVGELSVLSVLVVAIGAPVGEEIACRGIVFEFALRAFAPEHRIRWQGRADAAAQPPVRAGALLAANTVQALLFGIMHMNIVQGCYAFALGLVLGWVVWRTGRLRYSILLHLVMNFSSFFVGLLMYALAGAGVAGELIVSAAICALGAAAFHRATAAR